jgi:hypothetical protein
MHAILPSKTFPVLILYFGADEVQAISWRTNPVCAYAAHTGCHGSWASVYPWAAKCGQWRTDICWRPQKLCQVTILGLLQLQPLDLVKSRTIGTSCMSSVEYCRPQLQASNHSNLTDLTTFLELFTLIHLTSYLSIGFDACTCNFPANGTYDSSPISQPMERTKVSFVGSWIGWT